MKRIFISAGHSAGSGAKDKGVPPTPFSKGKSEGELTLELRDRIVEDLKRLGIHAQTDLNKNALVETLAWIKNVFKSDKDSILIDIHFNAFNKVANGVIRDLYEALDSIVDLLGIKIKTTENVTEE
jgi:N-acetylmuramoyl-L-alanine amidase